MFLITVLYYGEFYIQKHHLKRGKKNLNNFITMDKYDTTNFFLVTISPS